MGKNQTVYTRLLGFDILKSFFIESMLLNIKAIKFIRPCYNIEMILGYNSNSTFNIQNGGIGQSPSTPRKILYMSLWKLLKFYKFFIFSHFSFDFSPLLILQKNFEGGGLKPTKPPLLPTRLIRPLSQEIPLIKE